MRKLRCVLVMTAILYIFVSCSEGLLSDMDRVIEDPVVVRPGVDSFSEEGVIKISWDNDPGADEYVLYRAADTAVPSYGVIYRGSKLFFEDRDVETGNRYLYTLAKIRGERVFGPSGASLGAESGIVLDEYEDNGSKEKAILLEWDLQSNLYYYQSYGEEKIEDYDWYRVEVPPRRKAMVVVTQDGLNSGESSWLIFYLEGHTPFTVTNGDAVEIPNYNYETKELNFCISPRAAGFVTDLTKGGGGFITYTVSLSQITGI